jgi:hypothetical protein
MAATNNTSPWGAGGSGWSTAGDIAAGVGNVFGSIQQQNYSNAAASSSDAYNSALYKYNWREQKRDYKYAQKGVEIARKNDRNERAWRDETALLDYKHGMAIRDYEYKNQMRAYNKSEETYRQQLNFNNMAAQVAMESEDRWLDERFKETAFANQDLMVQLLQEEGKAGLLQAGRSAGKAVQSAMAAAGRNQAILVESLVSAEKQSQVNRKKIQTDKYGADLMADANRMLKPEIAPALPKPIPLPAAIFQNPQKPKKPPKPPKTQRTDNTAGTIMGIAQVGIGIASLFSDEQLKENIVKVGQSDSGINIYEFNYINDPQRYRGVIAQDLLASHPEAVSVHDSGFYQVNYALIDVNMQPV